MLASDSGMKDVVKSLVAHGAIVSAAQNVCYIIYLLYMIIVKLLNISLLQNGKKAIYYAIMKGYTDVVSILIQHDDNWDSFLSSVSEFICIITYINLVLSTISLDAHF